MGRRQPQVQPRAPPEGRESRSASARAPSARSTRSASGRAISRPSRSARITALSDQLPAISELRLQDRIRRQREFRQLLELRASGDFQQRLTRYLLDWESGRAPEYDRVLTEWWEMRQDYFIALYRLLTPEQRTAVLRRLQDYIDDFTRLSERPAQSAKQP